MNSAIHDMLVLMREQKPGMKTELYSNVEGIFVARVLLYGDTECAVVGFGSTPEDALEELGEKIVSRLGGKR